MGHGSGGQALRGEETGNFQMMVTTKLGARVYLLLNATARRNARGDPVSTESGGFTEGNVFLGLSSRVQHIFILRGERAVRVLDEGKLAMRSKPLLRGAWRRDSR